MDFLVIAILIGLLPGYLAQKKGRSFVPWWIYGALLFIVALPHALLMKPLPGSKNERDLEHRQIMKDLNAPGAKERHRVECQRAIERGVEDNLRRSYGCTE
jgi:hypothetical protein